MKDPVSIPSARPEAADATRRRLLYAGVAAAAGAAGAGWAWWRVQPHGDPAAMDAESMLFEQSFEMADGTPLALADFRGKPLLLNFWATWCPPCVAELPMLSRFYDAHRAHGWLVVGLAVDQPSAVRKYLERQPISFPSAMAGLGGADLSRSLGNLTGGLPFTVVWGADGRVRHRKMGQLEEADLQKWAAQGA